MPITIRESFQVQAPIDEVWRFLLDPHQVAACMPGAGLDQVVDDSTFLGNIKVKVGPIVASYQGRVQLTLVDPAAYLVEMAAEGLEAGGGTARGTMSSRLTALPDGGTEVSSEATAELTGRIMQFGQGMVEGVSKQLFQQFVACAGQRLAAGPEVAAALAEGAGEKRPIPLLSVVLKALWAAAVGFFRRLFRRSPA